MGAEETLCKWEKSREQRHTDTKQARSAEIQNNTNVDATTISMHKIK